MKEWSEWFEEISEFAFIQFDRQKLGRLSMRDFRGLVRYDLTVQAVLKKITPKKDEFECFKYAAAIARKNEKKKSKKEKKKQMAAQKSKHETTL